MNTEDIYKRLVEKYGEFKDSGIINSNGENIRDILWEIEGVYLYPQIRERDILYVVHHPISRFSLAFEGDNKPDEEVQNYLLEYKAKKFNLNIMCIHSLADKMLESELRTYLKDKDSSNIIEHLKTYFKKYVNFEFKMYLTPTAERLLKNHKYKKIEVMLATYNYKICKSVIYIDELGATDELEDEDNKNAGILIPHSVVDISAMSILEKEIRKILSQT